MFKRLPELVVASILVISDTTVMGDCTDGQVNIPNALGQYVSGRSEQFVVNGSIFATSVIGAVDRDLGEWVPASLEMAPGTVVVVDGGARNTVAPSSQPYDTRVAGVQVRVHAFNTPIHIGDLLVTSDRPGMAMRSEGLDLGGVKMHRPGTLIGKALEPLENGEGEILVLLSLQ